MAFLFTIGGVDCVPLLREGTLEIDKHYGTEVLTCETWDRGPLSGSYIPADGDDVYAEIDGHLLFGGTVVDVDASPIINESGTRVTITAQDYGLVAHKINVIALTIPSGPVRDIADDLCTQFLVPRGYTNIGTPTGGPTIDAIDVEYATLADVLSLLSELSGYFWRINGDKEFALTNPGALSGPVTLSVANGNIRERAFGYQRSRLEHASRLFVRTGVPASGAGPAMHRETRTANGTHTVFPCNVESVRKRGAINNTGGYSSSATAMALDGLYPSQTLRTGDTFVVTGQSDTYTLTGDASIDADGACSIAFTPGLSAAVDDDTAVVFAAETFVGLEVNGTPTALGGQWTFSARHNSFTKSGGTPSGGTTVTKVEPITFPAIVRVWASSLVQSTGAVDADAAIDAVIDKDDLTEVGAAAEWGRNEVARRVQSPWRVTVLTPELGFYPLQEAQVDIPNRVSNTFLIERTRHDIDIDGRVLTEIHALEGNRLGQAWFEYFRQRRASSGGSLNVSGGGSAGTGGGSGGGTGLPTGHTVPFGGDNANVYTVSTTWTNWPEYIPTQLPVGDYVLRTPMHLIAAGTLEAQLLNQDDGVTVLASTSTTKTGTLTNQDFAYPTDGFSIATPTNVLLQYRRASGTGKAKLGQATAVRT